MSNPVFGYEYVGMDDDDLHNMSICQIVARAPQTDVEAREYGPAFTVQFGDGHRRNVFAHELHPWYPV